MQNFLWRWPVDDEVFEWLAFNTELNPVNIFGSNFEVHRFRLVDKDTVAVISDVERNVLVGLVRASSPILVNRPDFLTVLYKVAEAFTQAVNVGVDAEGQLFAHVVLAVVSVGNFTLGAVTGGRDFLPIGVEGHGKFLPQRHVNLKAPTLQWGRLVVNVNIDIRVPVGQSEGGFLLVLVKVR